MRRFHFKAATLIPFLIVTLSLVSCTRSRPQVEPPPAPAAAAQVSVGAALATTTQEGAPTTIAILPTATPTIVSVTPTPLAVDAVPTVAPAAEDTPTPTPVTSFPSPQGTPSGQEIIHLVQPGENLFRIGLKYGLDANTLAEFNGISDPDTIYVGQSIKIPGEYAPVSQGGIHTVRPGETLTSIALQYGVGVQALMAANNLRDPDRINVGQQLLIP